MEHILEEIADTKYILTLQEDWDSYGALPIEPKAYWGAITLLLNYTIQIHNKYGVWIQSPQIDPTPRGGIQLWWHEDSRRLLIDYEMKDDVPVVRYYTDLLGHNPSTGDLDGFIVDECIMGFLTSNL